MRMADDAAATARPATAAQAAGPLGLLIAILAGSVYLFGDASSSGPNQVALMLAAAAAAQGAGSAAVVNAIADALESLGEGRGDFHRSPVTRDMILTNVEQAPAGHDRLRAHV